MTGDGPGRALDHQRFFAAVPDPCLVLDPELTIVAVNPAYLAATCHPSSDDLLGRHIFEAFPDNPSDPAADGVRNLRRSLQTVLATGRSDAMAVQRYDILVGPVQRFEERHWSPVNVPVLDTRGEVENIVHRVADVTAYVRQHHRADLAEGELFARGRELQDANRRLRAAQDAKDRFIATLSHELRSPLAALRAATELLELDTLSQGSSAVEVLRRQTDAMAKMTGDLFDVSRAASGQLVLDRERLDLREVVLSAVDDIRADYARHGRVLRESMPPRPVPVEGDRVRLGQLCGNLLANARKYTGPGGTVVCGLGRTAEEGLLTVRDDGIGFDPRIAESLFDAFARAASPGPRGVEGLGLGLAIVRRIAELHGGGVTARSDGPGRGAEFRVRLPLAADGPRSRDRPRPATVAAPRLRVLVIEDHADLAESYRTLLDRRGHHVVTAATGLDALAAFGKESFDVVLCDIGLPDIDGCEVVRRLRVAHPEGGRLRVLAVSGSGQESDRRRAVAAGCDGHLTKPVSVKDLEGLLGCPL